MSCRCHFTWMNFCGQCAGGGLRRATAVGRSKNCTAEANNPFGLCYGACPYDVRLGMLVKIVLDAALSLISAALGKLLIQDLDHH